MKAKKLQSIVPEYHSSNPIIRGLFQLRIQKAIALSHVEQLLSGSILDAGCGEGKLLKQLHDLYPRLNITGIDINTDTLELRKQLPSSINIQQLSLAETGFEKGGFDTIFCLDVLEHIENLDGVCKEIKRTLKENGQLVISAPTETFFYRLGRLISKGTWSEVDGPGAGQHYWDAYSLDSQLSIHGFSRKSTVKIPPIIGLDLFHISVYSAQS